MGIPLQALLVEDSPSDAELLLIALAEAGYGVQHERVQNAADLLAALEARSWDIVLCDYVMPGFSAPEAIRLVRQYSPDVPMIVISGTIGEEQAVEAIKLGATDYLLKDRLAGIGLAVRRALGQRQDSRAHAAATKALLRSEESLAQAQRIAHIGSWDLDLEDLDNLDANPLRWSDELFRIFGYQPGEIEVTNEIFFRRVHPDDRQKIRAAVAETLKSGRTYSIDHRIVLADGRERVVHEQATLLRDSAGKPVHLIGTAQDVTERWHTAEVLRESEERFRQMIENGSDIIALIDQQGIIRFQSPSTERILGHTPASMVGRRIEEYVHPDDLLKVQASIQRVMTSQAKPTPVEYRCRHRDGGWRAIQSFGKVMQAGKAGESMVVVNSRDVTESRALEEQLRQSQKMEAIGQLSGGVAHDFNNLLTVIKGHIGLLRARGQVSPEITGAIQQIDEAANRAANLTRQLLTFSRQQVMETAELNLTGIVMNMAKMLRRLLSENIEMELLAADQPLPIRADEGMVEQVLLNLVVNARDAMPRGGRLEVGTASADFDGNAPHPARAGAFACLYVRDTGTGIAPEVMSRIFEPFFTTKGIGQGTGLGLATVYGVMQQHSGWVTVESTVGQGSTFRAYFPREAIALPAMAPGAVASALPGGHEGILLVEDEAAVRDIAQAALTGLGYRVFAATSGLAALREWEIHRHEVDLLLTDLVMPEGVTGRDLALRLREAAPNLRIIFMSGYSYDVAGHDLALTEGVNYLPKPFDLAGLARIVRTRLDHDASRSPFGREVPG